MWFILNVINKRIDENKIVIFLRILRIINFVYVAFSLKSSLKIKPIVKKIFAQCLFLMQNNIVKELH